MRRAIVDNLLVTRFQVDPMKLCLGHHFYSKFSPLFVFVKLSDPAALKLN